MPWRCVDTRCLGCRRWSLHPTRSAPVHQRSSSRASVMKGTSMAARSRVGFFARCPTHGRKVAQPEAVMPRRGRWPDMGLSPGCANRCVLALYVFIGGSDNRLEATDKEASVNSREGVEAQSPGEAVLRNERERRLDLRARRNSDHSDTKPGSRFSRPHRRRASFARRPPGWSAGELRRVARGPPPLDCPFRGTLMGASAQARRRRR